MYKCTLSADGWQIYTSEDGAYNVGEKLTKKFNELVAGVYAEAGAFGFDPKQGAGHVKREMREYMENFSKFGATDTEPDCVLCDELQKAFDVVICRW